MISSFIYSFIDNFKYCVQLLSQETIENLIYCDVIYFYANQIPNYYEGFSSLEGFTDNDPTYGLKNFCKKRMDVISLNASHENIFFIQSVNVISEFLLKYANLPKEKKLHF